MASLALAFDILARDKASKEFDNVGDAADRTAKKGEKFGKVFAAGIAVAGAAVGKFGFDAVKNASASEQAFGGVQSVFGKAASKVEEFADRAGKGLGIAKSDYASLAAVVGSQLQRFGQSQDEAAVSTDKLVTLGADLAATYGGSVVDAVQAVSSLLKGERDPIEKYAVGINEAAISAQLAKDGLDKLKGSALDQAKAQATLKLLFDQTSAAQGAAARESGTLEGQTIRVAAQYKNLSADLGAKLLPVVSDAITKFTSLAEFVGRNSEVIIPLIGAVGTFATGLFIAVKGVAAFNAVSLALGSSVTVALGPLSLIVIAIAALVAGLVIAYKNSETFREIVNGALQKVKEGFAALGGIALGVIDKLLAGYQFLASAAGKLPGPLGAPFRAAEEAIKKTRGELAKLNDSLDASVRARVIPIRIEVGGNIKSTSGRLLDFRASGGPLNPRVPTVVGERGPEVIVPGRRSASVVANSDLQGMGGATYNLNVYERVEEAQIMALFRRMELLNA